MCRYFAKGKTQSDWTSKQAVHRASERQLLNFHQCGYSPLQPIITLTGDEFQKQDEVFHVTDFLKTVRRLKGYRSIRHFRKQRAKEYIRKLERCLKSVVGEMTQ
jgi:UDP-2,3-diacylglucosamine pyrophosphatase LpxH